MRAFNIGFIATLSLLLVFSVMFLTLGYYPAPKSPEYPKYPTTSSSYTNPDGTIDEAKYQEYNNAYDKYNKQVEKYDEKSKDFMKEQFVPYVQNVFVGWIVILVIFEAVAILLTKSVSPVIGGAYAFTGIWAIFVVPFIGGMLLAMFGVSSMSGGEEVADIAESMYRMLGITGVLGSVVLTILGIRFLSPKKDSELAK